MRAVIVTNGELENIERLKKQCLEADFILCADGGARFLKRAMLVPDYLIGDFDSIDRGILEYFKEAGAKIETWPSDKDFTDTELCIEKAIELGCNEVCIAAGIGGRLDHSLGNIGLLHRLNQQKVKGWIDSDHASIYLCSGGFQNELELCEDPGTTVSILPHMGNAIGVTLHGFRYPLDNALIEFGRPIGISNHMQEQNATVSLQEGELLVIVQHII